MNRTHKHQNVPNGIQPELIKYRRKVHLQGVNALLEYMATQENTCIKSEQVQKDMIKYDEQSFVFNKMTTRKSKKCFGLGNYLEPIDLNSFKEGELDDKALFIIIENYSRYVNGLEKISEDYYNLSKKKYKLNEDSLCELDSVTTLVMIITVRILIKSIKPLMI